MVENHGEHQVYSMGHSLELEVFSVCKMIVERAAVDSCIYTDCFLRIIECRLVFFLIKNLQT